MAFVVAVVLILSGALVVLLALNTAVAEDAFRVHELRQQSAAAADREQAVERQVEALRAPHALAARASALGLAPAGSPVFLRLPEGTVVGTVPATPSPSPPAPVTAGLPPAGELRLDTVEPR
jgi:hypothetical protein